MSANGLCLCLCHSAALLARKYDSGPHLRRSTQY